MQENVAWQTIEMLVLIIKVILIIITYSVRSDFKISYIINILSIYENSNKNVYKKKIIYIYFQLLLSIRDILFILKDEYNKEI